MTERINQKKNFSRELGYSKSDGFSRSGRGVPVLFGAVAGLYFFFEIEQSPNNSKVILSSEQHLQKSNRTNSHLKDSIMEH